MATIETDIDVNDYFDNCCNSERRELLDLIIKDIGYVQLIKQLPKEYKVEALKFDSEKVWIKTLQKLVNHRHLLTNDEENLIVEISKRFN